MADVQILLVSGSTRGGSINTAVLRTARAVAPPGVTGVLYEGLTDLPAFNPDEDREPVHGAVTWMRDVFRTADAVLFCTPEYAGSLPGSFKNLLDWTVGNGDLYGKPVAWVNVAAEGRGEGAHAALATVLGYVGAVMIEPACVRLPIPRHAVGPDGKVVGSTLRAHLTEILITMALAVQTSTAI